MFNVKKISSIIIITIISIIYLNNSFAQDQISFDFERAKNTRDILFKGFGEDNDLFGNINLLKRNIKAVESQKDYILEDGYVVFMILMKFYTNGLANIMLFDHEFLDRDDIHEKNHNKVILMTMQHTELRNAENNSKNKKIINKLNSNLSDILIIMSKEIN